MRSKRFTPWLLLFAALLAGESAAQVRQMETVGAYPLSTSAKRAASARDSAVKLALGEAVMQVAMDLVTGVKREEAAEFLPEVLGNDPLDYISRFRVIEDRGERPTQYSQDPSVEFEYVVLVESHIDSTRVRLRLEEAGLLMTRAQTPVRQLLVVLEGDTDFAAYEAFRRTLLDQVRVRTAAPVEMEQGRIVLAIETSRSARQLLENLLRSAPSGLRVTPVDSRPGLLTLAIDFEEMPASPGGAAPATTADGARDHD